MTVGLGGALAVGIVFVYVVGDGSKIGGTAYFASTVLVLVSAIAGMLPATLRARDREHDELSISKHSSPEWQLYAALGILLLVAFVGVIWFRSFEDEIDVRVAILFDIWAVIAFVLAYTVAAYFELEKNDRQRLERERRAEWERIGWERRAAEKRMDKLEQALDTVAWNLERRVSELEGRVSELKESKRSPRGPAPTA